MLRRAVAAICFLLPSGPSRVIYRLAGYSIGRNVKLPWLSYVFAEEISLGDDVDIRPLVFINVRRLELGRCTIVSFGVQIVGENDFATGDNCFIGAHSIVHCDEKVRFGFYSGIGPRCMVYTHGSFLPVTLGYPASFAEVVLEDFVWTAMGVMFLPGAHVESECIVNPGVVVSGRVRRGTRLQFGKDSFAQLEQSRLLRFARRPVAYYHHAIIEGFFATLGNTCESIPSGVGYRTSSGVELRTYPETDRLELWRGGVRVATYWLSDYFADASTDHVHRAFLQFLRRRFGLTLRTRYSTKRSEFES